ncbi:MAG TPA: hypothetical protein VJ023_21950 [Pyrinomonadaceae bacterium]|nr:hypothetical protein [Pyrinomonadaceae bacterium]
MPSWHERFVSRARTDGVLRRQLHELARLDANAMANASQALTTGWSQVAQQVDSLCDQVAQRVVEPGEEVDEAAQWISYNCQSVARELPASSSFAAVIPLLLAVIGAVAYYLVFRSWIFAILGGIVVYGLVSWLRGKTRR